MEMTTMDSVRQYLPSSCYLLSVTCYPLSALYSTHVTPRVPSTHRRTPEERMNGYSDHGPNRKRMHC